MGLITSLLVRAPVEAFAKTLAGDIAKRYPPALDQQPGKRPSVNRLTRIMEDATKKAVEFHHEHHLGGWPRRPSATAFAGNCRDLAIRRTSSISRQRLWW